MTELSTEVGGLHSAIMEARARAKSLDLPFVVYLLDLAIVALKQDCAGR